MAIITKNTVNVLALESKCKNFNCKKKTVKICNNYNDTFCLCGVTEVCLVCGLTETCTTARLIDATLTTMTS